MACIVQKSCKHNAKVNIGTFIRYIYWRTLSINLFSILRYKVNEMQIKLEISNKISSRYCRFMAQFLGNKNGLQCSRRI